MKMVDNIGFDKNTLDFVRESNHIERIYRDGTSEEVVELIRFVALESMTVEEIEKFVSIYQPDAKLRTRRGMNVQVGGYLPPQGGPEIRPMLEEILRSSVDAWDLHIKYEKLHPFMDGNGRSGRALWAWKMKKVPSSFLTEFYFQTLRAIDFKVSLK